MATQLAASSSPPTPGVFLFGAPQPRRSDAAFAAALRAAVAAEKRASPGRNAQQRIALFICELGKAYGCNKELPLSRAALASALDISLVRVKRTLALLSLSGVLTCDGNCIHVLDWRKLSGAARFDPANLNLAEMDEDDVLPCADREAETPSLTASGDPACFV
jgi:hypothetical protein